RSLQPARGKDGGEQAVRTAVDVVPGDDVAASRKQSHDRGFGRHAGRRGGGASAAFERGQALLQRLARRVGGAAVVKALRLPRRLKGKGRGRVDGNRDCVECGVLARASLNADGFSLVFAHLGKFHGPGLARPPRAGTALGGAGARLNNLNGGASAPRTGRPRSGSRTRPGQAKTSEIGRAHV